MPSLFDQIVQYMEKEIEKLNNYIQEKKDEEKKEEAEKKPAAEAKPKKPMSHVKDYEEDTVYLFQFTRSPQVGS